MESNNKLWLGLGAVCVAGTMVSCTGTQSAGMTGMDHGLPDPATITTGEGGEGGEGASTEDSISSDAVYLGQLGFIRGHLGVGVELYRQGDTDAAETHMKHPEDEIYAALAPALQARNAPEFGDELGALATVVEERRPLAEVEEAYNQLMQIISRAEDVITEQDARLWGDVIVDLVSTAAAEYDIAAADDLALENAHEYQDSYGFMQIAYDVLERLQGMNADARILGAVRDQMDSIMPSWTGVQPPQRLHTEPSVLFGAAARIELSVSGL